MRPCDRLLLGMLAALYPAAAITQTPSSVAETCAYDVCALRQEGGKIVRGALGEPVGSLGMFTALRLTPLVTVASDSAVANARVFDREYRRGTALLWTGAIAAAIPLAIASHRMRDGRYTQSSNLSVISFALPGLAVELWGANRIQRATRALGRAIWWHNRSTSR